MLRGLALLAAVAGGNLAVTTSPAHPRAGARVGVYATGQVGDTGGRLYLFRNVGTRCADSVSAQRALGRKARPLGKPLDVDGAFETRVSYLPRRAGREWVCGYLYANTCDELLKTCGPAVGLPPDAGFSRTRVTVRARRAR